jgi:glycosyltransferase involved in cell wall biosynthesis
VSACRVSAIVSAYRCARFLRGRLENLREQTLARRGELEVVVIDSASPEDEGAIVAELGRAWPELVYLRTPERETVYAAWNRGVALARGRYLINANCDDRFTPDGLERLADALDEDPSASASYGDWLTTTVENDSFDSASKKLLFRYPEFHPPLLFYFQITSHAALVRRECYARIGRYDPTLRVFGDREWMLRFAAVGLHARRVSALVGLYLENPGGLEGSERAGAAEFAELRRRYLEPDQLCRLFGLPAPGPPACLAALYASVGSLGYRFYRWGDREASDLAFSAHLFQRALQADPSNLVALNDLAILLAAAGEGAEAGLLLRAAARAAPLHAALAWNQRALRGGARAVQEFRWLTAPGRSTPRLVHASSR